MSAEKPRRYDGIGLPDPEGGYVAASDFDAREALWREFLEEIEDANYMDSAVTIRCKELRRLLGIEEGE